MSDDGNYNSTGKSNISRLDKWKESIGAGRLFIDFLKKQAELHPEISKSIYATSQIYWSEMIGLEKIYSKATDEEIDKMYKKATWLVECDYIRVFRCEKCHVVYFYIEPANINDDAPYWDMVFAKNRCFTLDGGFGNYGSEKYDMEKIELDLCERCYGEIKSGMFVSED